MWGLFFLTTLIVAASLFLPGYAVMRGFGVVRCLAVSLAPLLGVAAYVVVGIAYSLFGVRSSWVSQAGLLLAVSLVAYLLLRRGRRNEKCIAFGLSDHGKLCRGKVSFDVACLLGYLVLGVCGFVCAAVR